MGQHRVLDAFKVFQRVLPDVQTNDTGRPVPFS
jgi:hypothetical protein